MLTMRISTSNGKEIVGSYGDTQLKEYDSLTRVEHW